MFFVFVYRARCGRDEGSQGGSRGGLRWAAAETGNRARNEQSRRRVTGAQVVSRGVLNDKKSGTEYIFSHRGGVSTPMQHCGRKCKDRLLFIFIPQRTLFFRPEEYGLHTWGQIAI